MLPRVAEYGRSRKWGYRGVRLGFKQKGRPKCAEGTVWDLAGPCGSIGGERTLAGHEEVPRGFGLRIGDRGDTADGAGNHRRPASQARTTGRNREK